jgi:hypothetical protein
MYVYSDCVASSQKRFQVLFTSSSAFCAAFYSIVNAKMSPIIQHPCLFINNDEDKATTLHVNLLEPPIWEDFVLKPTVKRLKIQGDEDRDIDTTDVMLQLFVALQSHNGIESFGFHQCEIKDLGHLAYWWTAKMREWNGVNDQTPLLTLTFENCDIENAAATAISFILRAGCIGDISFTDCHFVYDCAEIIEEGLKGNQSLTKVHFQLNETDGSASLMNGVLAMLGTNQKILKLGLDMRNGPKCWDIYRSTEASTTLQSLQLYNTQLDVPAVLAVMKMCQDIKSLKEVSFKHCDFTSSGIQFLIEQLSKRVALDDLDIELCKLTKPFTVPLVLRWRRVQVTNFHLAGTQFGQEPMSSSFGEIAANNNVQCLDLSRVMDRDEDFQRMCDTMISGNSGPSSLVVQQVQHCSAMLVEALRQSTKLTSLTFAKMDEAGMILFAQGLAQMSSLRQLFIGFQDMDNHYSEEFFKSLRDSLEVNTTLWSLSLRGIDSDNAMAKAYLPRVRYLLAINRVGRSSLFTANVPVGIWSHILARCPSDPDGILFVLTGKPELLARPTRKRGRCELSREVMRADGERAND